MRKTLLFVCCVVLCLAVKPEKIHHVSEQHREGASEERKRKSSEFIVE